MGIEIEGRVRQRARRLLVVGLVVLASAFLTACGAPPTASGSAASGGAGATTAAAASAQVDGAAADSRAKPAAQTSEGGQITVAATWVGRGGGPVFEIALDTHSVDLDSIDLAQSAVLRTDRGAEAKPLGWDAPKGGHHRSGTLTFPTSAADGTPLIGDGIRAIELVIRGVAGVPERTFRWELSS